jgi:spore germination cell wall hydrolase CwlJ-like protein
MQRCFIEQAFCDPSQKIPKVVWVYNSNKVWWDVERYLAQTAKSVRLKMGQQKACSIAVTKITLAQNRHNREVVFGVEDLGSQLMHSAAGQE